MDSTFDCPNCGQKLTAKPEMAGVIIDCPACGSQIQVPAFEAPVPMVPQPPASPSGTIPQRLQNPYGQQISPQPYGQMAPQPYPQQMQQPQQPYGYVPQPGPKSNTGLVVGLLAAFVLVAAGIAAYYFIVVKGESQKSSVSSSVTTGTSGSSSPRIPIVTTEEDRVKSLVTSVLRANKRGDYGSEYWVSWASSKKLIAPTSWEIVDVSVSGTSATVVVQVDSSNGLGMKISRLWKFWLTKETGTWKVFSIDEQD